MAKKRKRKAKPAVRHLPFSIGYYPSEIVRDLGSAAQPTVVDLLLRIERLLVEIRDAGRLQRRRSAA